MVPTDAEDRRGRAWSARSSSSAPGSTTAYQQFRFAFPDRVSAALDTVRERELALLVDALDDLPAYEIRHPYPVRLHELYDAADPYC